MPEWLQQTFPNESELPPLLLLARLLTALVLGCVIAGIYRLTRRPDKDSPSLVPTLVLLTVLIGIITLVIGNSVARAFSLVGALAIVRFRTVVEDTRDTAFVIFAVAVGMAVGAGYLAVVLVGVPVTALGALMFRQRTPPVVTGAHRLIVRVAIGFDPESVLGPAFVRCLEDYDLIAAETARQGAALELVYAIRLRPDASLVGLVTELNGLQGVQGVEVRRRD